MVKTKIKGILENTRVVAEDNSQSRSIYNKSRFGELKGKKFVYSLVEALYLIEKGILDVYDGRNKVLDENSFTKKAKKEEKRFWIKYCTFKDMRLRGYIVKTALKFGADFRVYERGIKPGEDHAKWIMYVVHEGENFTWYDFSAKNRVAHSTKKNLLVSVVDNEEDITHYTISWIRP